MTAVIPTRRGRGQALSRPISIICGPETLQTQPQGGIRKEGPLDGLTFPVRTTDYWRQEVASNPSSDLSCGN